MRKDSLCEFYFCELFFPHIHAHIIHRNSQMGKWDSKKKKKMNGFIYRALAHTDNFSNVIIWIFRKISVYLTFFFWWFNSLVRIKNKCYSVTGQFKILVLVLRNCFHYTQCCCMSVCIQLISISFRICIWITSPTCLKQFIWNSHNIYSINKIPFSVHEAQ